MKTIYNTYVVMQDQEQCDRMKSLCIENGLFIGKESDFKFDYKGDYFEYYEDEFFVFYYNTVPKSQTQATEQEFIELLKQHKMLDTYNEHSPLHPANINVQLDELEEQKQENFKLRMKIQGLEIGISECIEILEQTELTLVLNKLKRL